MSQRISFNIAKHPVEPRDLEKVSHKEGSFLCKMNITHNTLHWSMNPVL